MPLDVAVTGATGFIGRALCRALALRGHRVRAFVRRGVTPPDGSTDIFPIEDLNDAASLRDGCAGADAVVHLAARVHVLRDTAADPDEAFRLANVVGTRHVLEAAAVGNVKRVVLMSSVKAVGDFSTAPWTEDQVPAPTDAYGRSKLEAEKLGLEFARNSGINVAVLRLPLVYGPGATANVERLLRLVEKGWPLPFGSIRNRRSMIFVENAVAAIVALLETPSATNGVFFASDGNDLSTPELIRIIARSLGKPARLVPVPVWLLRLLGRVGDRGLKWFPSPVTSAEIERLTGSLAVETGKLAAATGWRAPASPSEGWQQTVRWYRTAQRPA